MLLAGGAVANVATIVFDVVVDPGVADGTVISNQGFASALLGGIVDRPSDDPTTPLVDDPTRDVVGNAPLLFATKSVVIGTDNGTPGVVDPLDVLHYTITVLNTGNIAASAAVLSDPVPANTTWQSDSLLLNGLPVGVPDGGTSPLAGGIGIASSDETPPLPGPAGGTLSPGESATIEFDLQVDAGVPGGTLISNQAIVGTAELPNLLTDGDGNPATGPEPTVVVVGAGQQLAISKLVSVVGGGPALAGSRLEYEVRVTNVGTVDALNVVITDDVDPAVLAYVLGSATLDGVAGDVAVAGTLLTADYSAANGPLPVGTTTVLRFRADVDGGLVDGDTITNVGVVTWNAPPQTENASVSIDVGGTPGAAGLNGTAWHDENFDDVLDGGETLLTGWTVELLRGGIGGTPVQSALTDVAGAWSLTGVAPNDLNGEIYALRFTAPSAGPNTAPLGSPTAFSRSPTWSLPAAPTSRTSTCPSTPTAWSTTAWTARRSRAPRSPCWQTARASPCRAAASRSRSSRARSRAPTASTSSTSSSAIRAARAPAATKSPSRCRRAAPTRPDPRRSFRR